MSLKKSKVTFLEVLEFKARNGNLYVYNVIRLKQPSFGMRTIFLMRKTVLKTDIILRNNKKA
jgi:hypothetical protein